MKKTIITLVVFISIPVLCFAEYPISIYFLEKAPGKIDGVEKIIMSEGKYSIIQYERVIYQKDIYSPGSPEVGLSYFTTIFIADGISYLLFPEGTNHGEIKNGTGMIKWDTKDRFFIGFYVEPGASLKVGPYPVYSAYILQKIGGIYALFEIKTNFGTPSFIGESAWYTVKSIEKFGASSISFVFYDGEMNYLISCMLKWNGTLFLPLKQPFQYYPNAQTIDILNIRKGPGTGYEKLGIIEKDAYVTVLGCTDKIEIINGVKGIWYWVINETRDIEGWVFGGYLDYTYNIK